MTRCVVCSTWTSRKLALKEITSIEVKCTRIEITTPKLQPDRCRRDAESTGACATLESPHQVWFSFTRSNNSSIYFAATMSEAGHTYAEAVKFIVETLGLPAPPPEAKENWVIEISGSLRSITAVGPVVQVVSMWWPEPSDPDTVLGVEAVAAIELKISTLDAREEEDEEGDTRPATLKHWIAARLPGGYQAATYVGTGEDSRPQLAVEELLRDEDDGDGTDAENWRRVLPTLDECLFATCPEFRTAYDRVLMERLLKLRAQQEQEAEQEPGS